MRGLRPGLMPICLDGDALRLPVGAIGDVGLLLGLLGVSTVELVGVTMVGGMAMRRRGGRSVSAAWEIKKGLRFRS